MNYATARSLILFMALFLALLPACSRRAASTADIPRLLPASYKVTVAPFTQPKNPYHLISGQIPENQGLVPRDELLAMDRALKEILLQDTKRSYEFIPRSNLPVNWSEAKSSAQPGALSRWITYGREHGAEYLLVPQIMDWHERDGSEAGVSSPAHVRVEFYLLNIAHEGVQNRSIFEERQVGLADNLLTMGEFVKRRGQWVTAGDLAVEGIRKAIRDLGL